QVDAILRDTQIRPSRRANKRNPRVDIPGFDFQRGAYPKIGHSTNAEGPYDAGPLRQIGFLATRTCFPEVTLEDFIVHANTVILDSEALLLNRDFNSALCDRNSLCGATHQYGVVRVLHVFAQERLWRVIYF